MTLFCKDCKHVGGVQKDLSTDFDPPCNAPQNMIEETDQTKYLVTGIAQPVKLISRGNSCAALRMERNAATTTLTCGPEGLWFEASVTGLE